MKIVGFKNNDVRLGNDIMLSRDLTLIVEMTQEEYQKCCAILYKEKEMNRLTTNIEEKHNMSIDEMNAYITKHKQIEQELGIDLITLFKALKQGIWTKDGYCSEMLVNKPTFIESPEIGISSCYEEIDENCIPIVKDENVMCIYTYDYESRIHETRIKDYGRTWSLVKEDLKKY